MKAQREPQWKPKDSKSTNARGSVKQKAVALARVRKKLRTTMTRKHRPAIIRTVPKSKIGTTARGALRKQPKPQRLSSCHLKIMQHLPLFGRFATSPCLVHLNKPAWIEYAIEHSRETPPSTRIVRYRNKTALVPISKSGPFIVNEPRFDWNVFGPPFVRRDTRLISYIEEPFPSARELKRFPRFFSLAFYLFPWYSYLAFSTCAFDSR